jgi:hypothetical protein
MEIRNIEDRVAEWVELASPDQHIMVHPIDVPAILRSKVFKAESEDGKPMYNGLPFRVLPRTQAQQKRLAAVSIINDIIHYTPRTTA